MNNHPSIHRNAKVHIMPVETYNNDVQEQHYQGTIVSADNIGITLSGAVSFLRTSDLQLVTATMPAVQRNAILEEAMKKREKFGTFFLPWSNIAEVEVL